MDKHSDELGEVIATQRGFPLNRRDLWWFLGGLICLLAPLSYGVWLFGHIEQSLGLVAAIFQSRAWFMIAYLFFLILASLLFLRIWSSRRFISVYENGLRWRLRGFSTHHLAWQEIDGIACANIDHQLFGNTIKNEQLAVIYLKNGKRVEFDDRIQNLPELIERLKEQFYPTILPELVNQLNAGNEIHFGPITLKKQAIGFPKRISQTDFLDMPQPPKSQKTVPWSNIAGLAVQSGFLMVKSENSIIKKIPVSQIPNFEILLKLFEQRLLT